MNGMLIDNRYRLLRYIGKGQSAHVYLAHDEQSDREVALKIFDETQLSDTNLLSLFERELKVAARLVPHPNLLSYYGGSMKAGCRYIVMEVARGESLVHYMNRLGGKIPHDEAVNIFCQLLSALSLIHQKGVIHRDVKPHNILLLSDGTIKLCDFGIAVLTDSDNYATGKAAGTALYISPEQAMGRAVSPASDLYSAGILLYEMLSGVLPFTSDKQSNQDKIEDIIRKHLKESPVRPSHYNPNIPEGLEQIVLRSLNKNPEARFQTADEMLRYLAIYLKTPTIEFNFDLPEDEFDSSAALPHQTLPNGYKPKLTVRSAPTKKHTISPTDSASLTRTKLIWISIVLILSVIAAFVIYFTLHSLIFYPSDLRSVITRGDLLYSEFSTSLQEQLVNEGYDLKIRYDFSRYYPEGTIIAQTPPPFSLQRLNSDAKPELSLTICSKEYRIVLDDYAGRDYREIESELSLMGIQTRLIRRPSSKPKGTIIETVPEKGDTVTYSDTVTLVVSCDEKPQYKYIPNLIGLSIYEAKSKLSSLGITIDDIVYRDSSAPHLEVIAQSRPYGEKLPVDFYGITLTVSLGMPTTEDTKEPEETLPDSSTTDEPQMPPFTTGIPETTDPLFS